MSAPGSSVVASHRSRRALSVFGRRANAALQSRLPDGVLNDAHSLGFAEDVGKFRLRGG